jgi:hypothetical protein
MDDTRLPSIDMNEPPMSSRKCALNFGVLVTLALARLGAAMTDTWSPNYEGR